MKKNLTHLFIFGFSVLFLNACGGFKSLGTNLLESLGEAEVSSTKVVAVVSQNQILTNYQSCLKLPADKISSQSRNALNDSIKSLPPEGEVEAISAPMLMAVTKVVAEVCNDLINYEKTLSTDRTYFKDFNLTGTASGKAVSNASLEEETLSSVDLAMIELSRACWGRTMTADELNILRGALNKDASLQTANRDAALLSCTAVLASSQAIRF
ncbi:MAG: hypothetical protein KDD33_12535 [Bdellovibrionales bacterium]|nr:hypothetical protein [Bdellovibrionales bacterium]